MIIQGRHMSNERVHKVKLNASYDGEDWISYDYLNLVHDAAYEGYIAEISPSINAKFVRLIPVTDRAMPVCIRTEFFGCYRDDNFLGYSLSEAPTVVTPEFGLNGNLTGIGRLADENIDEFLSFSPNTEITLEWSEAVNVTELIFHLQFRSDSCLKSIRLKIGSETFRYSAIPCSVGHLAIPLLVSKVLHEILIIFDSDHVIELSELEWSNSGKPNPIKMDQIIATSDDLEAVSSWDFQSWLPLVAMILGSILVALVILTCCIVLRKRFRIRKPKAFSTYANSTTTTTTTLRFIPSRAPSSVKYSTNQYNQRAENVIANYGQNPHQDRLLSNASHVTTTSYGNGVFIQGSPPGGKDYSHEYSEIGSVTADSGNGDSLEGDKPSYAELNIA